MTQDIRPIEKKINYILDQAEIAAKSLNITIYENSVWFDKDFNAYIFSWVFGTEGQLSPHLDKPGIHFGFVLNYDEISNKYDKATVEWFKQNFQIEILYFKNSFPEDVYTKEEAIGDFEPLTLLDWDSYGKEKDPEEAKEKSSGKSGTENKTTNNTK